MKWPEGSGDPFTCSSIGGLITFLMLFFDFSCTKEVNASIEHTTCQEGTKNHTAVSYVIFRTHVSRWDWGGSVLLNYALSGIFQHSFMH